MDSLSSANHFDNLFKKWAVEKLGSGVQIPETEFKCFVYQPETNSEQEKWNTNFSKKIERESNDIKPHPAYVWTMANRPHTGITLFSKHPNKDYMGSILSCFIAPPKQGFRLENMAKTEVTFSDFPNILIITCTRTLKEYDDLELTKHMLQYVIEHILVHSSELSVGWILFSNPGTNHRDPKCTLESFTVESLSKAYNFLKLTYKENTSHRKNDYLVGDTPNPGFPLYAYSYFTNDDKTKRELIANENNIYGVHIKTLDRKFIRRFTYPNTDDIYFSDHTQLDFFGDHVLVNEKGNRGLPYQLPHQQWVGEEAKKAFNEFKNSSQIKWDRVSSIQESSLGMRVVTRTGSISNPQRLYASTRFTLLVKYVVHWTWSWGVDSVKWSWTVDSVKWIVGGDVLFKHQDRSML